MISSIYIINYTYLSVIIGYERYYLYLLWVYFIDANSLHIYLYLQIFLSGNLFLIKILLFNISFAFQRINFCNKRINIDNCKLYDYNHLHEHKSKLYDLHNNFFPDTLLIWIRLQIIETITFEISSIILSKDHYKHKRNV